jgi:hypothetical protein
MSWETTTLVFQLALQLENQIVMQAVGGSSPTWAVVEHDSGC